MQDKFTVP